ncbi:5'-nucleotidase domain-containing protein 3 isoform X2 [Eurytemora carolleeae]|uniref:5'-nucleotidase domain-containing protein 3 isoform X2 n=1 Tax=Eurytemora carolleeae TaxID=1294199 RepID=UPI000C77B6CC|nr:5'-nucleotidase domain-containing protein 3 isoform X2 [Eurytemora carolleeae]|eukprot:XP_023340841.1 5'-nucleotidase domain-containing protein 3-like isoform X2 [Eurytemora affinis]
MQICVRAVTGLNRRGCVQINACIQRTFTSEDLWTNYEQAKSWLRCKKLPPDIETKAAFCNDQIDLSEVEIYGFDYDYTLASYKKGVEYLIHDIAKEHLVKKYGYPVGVGKVVYDPNFAIRGLHYDVEKGLFLKVDSFHQIQLGTVYRGREKLSDKDVLKLYKRRHLPVNYLESSFLTPKPMNVKMVQLVDIFSKPEMSLMAAVMDYFHTCEIEYQPESLYYDISKCIGLAHATFHAEIRSNPNLYLHKDPELAPYLKGLMESKKKIFLITNSPFETVDVGMKYMVGEDWRDLFDVIVVQAGKPHFFTNNAQPFRELDLTRNVFLWDKVHELAKGRIYAGGTLNHFQLLTGWKGGKVMYFGDHPYADLADVTLHHGWKTAAVIRELEKEIAMMNTEEFKWGVNWQQVLKSLIEDHQDVQEPEAKEVIEAWKIEVDAVSMSLRNMFNPHFGSMFRSHSNPTYFSRKLFRFSDIYTSRVTNLGQYSLNHTFYPSLGYLPHDFPYPDS